jgi:Immunoglobulin domain
MHAFVILRFIFRKRLDCIRVARQTFLKLAISTTIGLSLAACGGGSSEKGGGEQLDAVNSTPEAFTVVGVDKASVSFSNSIGGKRAEQVTVRVARDSTGAPPLQDDQTPLGPVYQFTPLGFADEGIEIRIPVSAQAAAHGQAVLHTAGPDGAWAKVVNAKREGGFIVARVASLSYATLATESSANATGRLSRLAAPPLSAPVITSSTGSQTVLVGQRATFTVTATGNPTPQFVWQRRRIVFPGPIDVTRSSSPTARERTSTSSSLPISDDQDWEDILGGSKGSYTTAPSTLANSGDEYRAVLTNSQGG